MKYMSNQISLTKEAVFGSNLDLDDPTKTVFAIMVSSL